MTPRASRNEIAAWRDGMLRVRVTAPPIDGKANAAVERLLARALGLPKSAVRVVSGAQGREKTVAVDGATRRDIVARLNETTRP